jgi:hypothetical protein
LDATKGAEAELARLTPLAERRPRDLYLASAAAGAALLAGDHAALSGDLFAARDAWNKGGRILVAASENQADSKNRRLGSLLDILENRQRSSIPTTSSEVVGWIHQYQEWR